MDEVARESHLLLGEGRSIHYRGVEWLPKLVLILEKF